MVNGELDSETPFSWELRNSRNFKSEQPQSLITVDSLLAKKETSDFGEIDQLVNNIDSPLICIYLYKATKNQWGFPFQDK